MPASDNRRLAAGYSDRNPGKDRVDASLAAMYRPEEDAEVERLRKIPNLPATVRMRIGYHDRAKAAAKAINERNTK